MRDWKKIFLWLLFMSRLVYAEIYDLIPAPIPAPFVVKPEASQEQNLFKRIDHLRSIKKNEHDWYELGLLYIAVGDLEAGKKYLIEAIYIEPTFFQARIQLGYIHLWQGDLLEARSQFETVLEEKPCEPKSINGLEQIAIAWSQEKTNQSETIDLLRQLIQCQPKNPDLHFYLGRLLGRSRQWDEAEKELQEALQIDPNYIDAEVQLASIYSQQKKWDLAEPIYQKHADHPEVRRSLANTLSAQQRYTEAKEQYAILIAENPNDQILWRNSFEAKSFSNVSTSLEATYTDAKENDPTLGVPVVKDYYFFSALNIRIPIFDQWRLDLKPYYYHQRENNIFNPSVNYVAFLSGAQVTSHYYFSPSWRWDVFARAFHAWGYQHNVLYPFRPSTRFEPGTSLICNSENHLFVLDAHIESFIIKNFAIQKSEILRKSIVDASYVYRPDIAYINPEMGAGALELFFQDHNREDIVFGLGQIDLFVPWLTTIYKIQHAHFKFLTPNYFSYDRQILQTLRVRLHTEFYSRADWELFWEHSWQSTHKLIMPVGDFIFVANNQYIIGNLIGSQLGYRYKDKLRFEIGGHYIRTTLVYRDWNLYGSILWQF